MDKIGIMEKTVYRLKKNKDFRRVYNHGRSYADRRLILYLSKNNYGGTRIGFSVSKKVGKAVIRNKVRRKLKEISRLNREKIKKGFDVIIIARPVVADCTYREMEKSFIWLLKKSGLLEEEER